MTTQTKTSLVLSGLDGSNPLAFLAALGTARVLSMVYSVESIRLGWQLAAGTWRPVISFADLTSVGDDRVNGDSKFDEFELEPATLCETMADWLSSPPQLSLLESQDLGDNLTISPEAFRTLASEQLDRACEGDASSNIALAFLAAFGTDAVHQPHSKDRSLMQDTALRTMSGAGHQHFIKFMREIIANTTSTHLYSSLFQRWTYEDDGRGMNLRWDPIDDRRYALRWKNPSSDPPTTMRGANRLAIEALPLFPTAPIGNSLQTTGFRSANGTFFCWPIWDSELTLPVVQFLLQRTQSETGDNASAERRAFGICAKYRSQRITIGKFRNFTPGTSV
ncbi:MAG: hypothetical protein R3E01_06925 [Pirellulaceae bacterium]|nr:hypothetical protein [Planctomycetales bacterium]